MIPLSTFAEGSLEDFWVTLFLFQKGNGTGWNGCVVLSGWMIVSGGAAWHFFKLRMGNAPAGAHNVHPTSSQLLSAICGL